MKKYINYSLCYAILAMIGGVFYREFTKFLGFTGVTALGKVHGHFFLLGMVVFLLVALFAGQYDLKTQKSFRVFMVLYNIGLPLTGAMLFVRGTLQVLGTPLLQYIWTRKPGSQSGFLSISCLSYNKRSNWLTKRSLGFHAR